VSRLLCGAIEYSSIAFHLLLSLSSWFAENKLWSVSVCFARSLPPDSPLNLAQSGYGIWNEEIEAGITEIESKIDIKIRDEESPYDFYTKSFYTRELFRYINGLRLVILYSSPWPLPDQAQEWFLRRNRIVKILERLVDENHSVCLLPLLLLSPVY